MKQIVLENGMVINAPLSLQIRTQLLLIRIQENT